MAVVVKKVLDGSLADIESGKYNIFVPISLGNLWFTRERVREFVQWALEHTKEKVVILVADDIQAINYEVLRGLSPEGAKQAARKLGDNFINMAERVVRSLPESDQNNVSVARWSDVEKGDFLEMQKALKEHYESNHDFQSAIHRIVQVMLADKVPEDSEAVHRLGDYVIEEMPLMFRGITVAGQHYDIFPYPGLGELDLLVSDIQNRRKFAGIADLLDLKEKQPMIEAYVE